MSGPRVVPELAMTEHDLDLEVRRLAKTYEWEPYHTHDSRRSHSGFPDWCLVRDDRLLFAELKGGPQRLARYRPSPDQQRWLDKLRRVPSVEVYLWCPDDLFSGEIDRALLPAGYRIKATR